MKKLLAAVSVLAMLSGCAEVASYAEKIQPGLTSLCSKAVSLAPLAGPEIAMFTIAGCGTAQAIDRLAADPSSTQWVEDLIKKSLRRGQLTS